ncbi:hypothetical protein [Mycobacterium sp. 236(2023)]|uniref:hypothetical protein n=1 Tax=Mycobacterium sp. 236(2023) TaxID=3038163 RepID=UPI002414EBCB|nr:hypothetical protein [Mycobacterium sp. 236(2023)]MDG4666070.1 hypothetical protein [Mycobacterium sp. 236(2023)]
MTYEYNALLSRINGYHLQSVHFSGGYLQLEFASLNSTDEPVLTCEVMPVVDTPAGTLVSGQAGYADVLRALIGHHVVGTAEAPHEGLRIEFAETVLTLRPTAVDLHGPVIAMLSDFGDSGSMIWRPGGEAFEYLG